MGQNTSYTIFRKIYPISSTVGVFSTTPCLELHDLSAFMFSDTKVF